MKDDTIRRSVLNALRKLNEDHLVDFNGVMIEETETSIIVRYPGLGTYWKYELSLEVNGYVTAPGISLAEFIAKEKLI